MTNNTCQNCGTPLTNDVAFCSNCGTAVNNGWNQTPPNQQYSPNTQPGINPYWPKKSKVAAGVLGILLGGLGIHKFYLGKIGQGILYLIFVWTYIPAIIGLVEGILYLCADDYDFQIKHKVRIK